MSATLFALSEVKMYKQLKERPRGYLRCITRTVMICDGCGTRIHYSSASDGRHLCEKCYKKLRGEKDVSKTNGH